MTKQASLENSNNKLSIWLICFLIAAIWFATFVLFRTAPEWDNMEELVWANSFELGYQKHPPLPVWIIYPFTMVFGKRMWLPFALGVACVAFAQIITYFFYLRIAKNSHISRAKDFAILAVLVASPLIYYTIRGGDFNHNEAQLWSIAAMYYFYYISWERERDLSISRNGFNWSWFLFGVVIGLAFISKYSVLIQVGVLLAHFLWSKRFRYLENWQGILLALIGFLLIAGPHLLWLYQQTILGQGPLYYVSHAMSQNATRMQNLVYIFSEFLLTQVYRVLSCFIVVGVIYWSCKTKSLNYSSGTKLNTWWSKIPRLDQHYLLFIALGPTLMAMIIGILSNEKIEAKWAVTFFIAIGFIGLFVANDHIKMGPLVRRVLVGHLILALIYGVISGPVASHFGYQGRSNFPSHNLASAIQKHWEEHPELTNGKPIRLVVGDTWIIGNLIIHEHVHDSRLIKPWIEANDLYSPWLKQEDKQQAALIMIDHAPKTAGQGYRAGHPASQKVQELFDLAPVKGIESITWTDKKGAAPLEVQWAILPYPHP